MRCRMRCGDIRRCGGPIRKPTPPTPPGPSQFNVVNGIFVDVNMSGTGTRKNTRAVGDRFTARVFMLNEDNPNYVLLEWTHGGATSMALMGLANDEHTQNMFADAIRNKLAREIETMYDNGEIENGFVKFTDDDWTKIQEYYDTDLTPESVATLQAELIDDAIVREPEQNCFTSMFFGKGAGPIPEVGVGKNEIYSASWRGLPDDQHIVDPVVYEIGDESIATITNYTVRPAEEQWSERYTGDILGVNTGQTTITFYSVNNPRGTKTVIPVTVTPPESYYYISLHEAGEIDVEVGNTYTCYAEVEDYNVGDTLAASGYDNSIISVEVVKASVSHGDWRSDWNINITGLQKGETRLRIHSVNNPEVYENLYVVVFAPAPVESIGAPSVNSIEEQQTTSTSVTFEYSPALATDMSDISFNSTNENVAAVRNVRYNNGVCTFSVLGVGIGSCTISYSLGNMTYSISVTVTEATAITLFEGPTGTIIRYPVSGDIVLTYTGGEALNLTTRQTPTITIADKNLGATRCYDYETDGETIDVEYCGLLYQYGNNHGFGYQDIPEEDIGSSLPEYDDGGVAYSPMNPYSSEKFCKTGWHDNVALRMRGTSADYIDNRQSAQTVTYEEWLRGPCPSGYHLGGEGEYYDLFTILQAIFAGLPVGWNRYLLMPGTPRISWGSKYEDGQYYASTGGQRMSRNNRRAALTYAGAIKGDFLDYGCAIRPFKNFGLLPPVVSSIGAPSENSITLDSGNEQAVTFSYYPANAQGVSSVISVTTSDENVANINSVDFSNGIGSILIYGAGEGNATVSYTFGQTTYTISVAVTAPQIIPLQSISGPGSASIAVGNEETINFTLSPSNATVELGDFDISSMEEQSVGVTDVQLENGVLSVTVTGFALMCGAPINVDYISSGGTIYASCYVDSYANVTISSDGELFQYGEPCDNPSTVTICDNQASWSLTNGALNVNGEEFHGGADATTWTMDGAEISDGDSGEITGDVTFNIGAMPQPYTITVETEAMPEGTVINYGINETWTYEAPESDFPMTFDFSEPISLSYQSDVIYCGALLDNGSYQFWGTYEDNSVYIEMNGEPLSHGDEITIDSDTTLKFVWDPPAPERCPASIQYVWGNDTTIEVGQTAAVITNFTTTAECENVDYSNIEAYVRASYNVPSDVATASIDFNENKVYVTGVKAGECTVMFTDGEHSWSNDVTVTAPQPTPAHITSVIPDSISINVGGMANVSISYEPYDGVTMFGATSSDTNIATADFMGASGGSGAVQVSGVNAGNTNVTVSDGFNSWTIPVTVTAPTPSAYATISSGSENVTMAPGDNVVKWITYSPSNANTSNITWTNSDSNVAHGSYQHLEDGECHTLIDALGEGTCTVTVSDGTNSYVYNVTVVGAEPEQGQLMFNCNSREFGSLIGPDGETWDWDTPYTFEPGTQITYNNGDTLTIGEDVFSLNPVFPASPNDIALDGNSMEIDVPYELSGTEGDIYIDFYFDPIGGNDFDFVDDGEGYYVGNSEFNFNGPSNFVEEGYVVENFDSGAEIENAIVTITGDGFPYYVEVKVPTGDVNPGERVRVVRRIEDGVELGELAGDIPSTQGYTMTINVENLPEGADINGGITDPQSGETLEEISVSSFPMTIDIIGSGGLGLNCNSHEGDGDISIDSFDEFDIVKQYEINIGCEGYKPLFEAVGFDLEDGGEGNYYGEISADNGIYSNVSMTISFTPIEEPEE